MNWRSSHLFLLFGALALLSAVPGTASAQAPTGSKSRVTTAMGTRSRGAGTDENIRHERAANKLHANMTAPANKSGEKRRGAGGFFSTIHVDNRTPDIIDIYINGDFKGTVPAYGDAESYGAPGAYTLYGLAVYDDGSSKHWGPFTQTVDSLWTCILN